MASRQYTYITKHRAAGLCCSCPNPVWRESRCFRCFVRSRLTKAGLTSFVKREKKTFEVFVVALRARMTRILEDDGFAVEAVKDPGALIDAAGIKWAVRGRPREKLLEVIGRLDDYAIMQRFKAYHKEAK